MIDGQTRHNWIKRFGVKKKTSDKVYGKKDRRLNKVKNINEN